MKIYLIRFYALILTAILLTNCKNEYPSSIDPKEDRIQYQRIKEKPLLNQPENKIVPPKEEKRKEQTPFEELESYYRSHVAIDNKDIYYNDFSNQLKIAKFQIPLDEVEIFYYSSEDSNKFNHAVEFRCKNGNCLNSNNMMALGATIPFKSEESSFKFINLINRVVKAGEGN